jgi:hypothetical protein
MELMIIPYIIIATLVGAGVLAQKFNATTANSNCYSHFDRTADRHANRSRISGSMRLYLGVSQRG